MQAVNSNSTDNCQQQINHKREGFDCIDRNFWSDENLSPSDIRVMGYLNSNADEFKPSLKTIAKMVHMSIKTVWKCVNNLIKNGYLIAVFKTGMKNLYKATSKISTSVGKSTTGTLVKNTTHRNSKEEKAYINDDIFYEPHEPDIPEPSSLDSNVLVDEFEKHEVDGENLTLYELKTRIGNRTHGTNYNWAESNRNFKAWIMKHGAQTVWDAARALIRSVQGRTIKHDKKFVRAMNMKLQEVVCE